MKFDDLSHNFEWYIFENVNTSSRFATAALCGTGSQLDLPAELYS